MQRRQFIRRAFGLGASVALGPSLADADIRRFFTGLDPKKGTLLERAETVMARSHTRFRGLYHGYGVALYQILEEKGVPLPDIPKRTHPAWPYIHCICHCNSVANLGEEGVKLSQYAGLDDELNQAGFAHLFWDTIYPMIWEDIVVKHTGRSALRLARREMRVAMDYLFGDERSRRRALGVAALSDKKGRDRLIELRETIYGLVDACESAWQVSDFYDNAIGRLGGTQCPGGRSAKGRLDFCCDWCRDHATPSNSAEGPKTSRPWGPLHPLTPGRVPTIHESLYGGLVPPLNPLLNVPHPEFQPAHRISLDAPARAQTAQREKSG